MCRKRSASAIPVLIKNWFASAASSCWQWLRRGAANQTTSSRTGNGQGKSSFAPYERAHRGRHSTSCHHGFPSSPAVLLREHVESRPLVTTMVPSYLGLLRPNQRLR